VCVCKDKSYLYDAVTVNMKCKDFVPFLSPEGPSVPHFVDRSVPSVYEPFN
jgi:hypothetical protein